MRWHLQRKRSRTNDQGHVYCEAMIVGRPDGKRPTVSLGFLADHEIAFVKEAMATAPTALFTVSKAAQKTYLLDATTWPEIEQEFEKLEAEARRQQALVAATLAGQRQYAAMTLRQFYDQVWSPYSQHTEPSTWKREDASRWPHILAHLGHVLLRDLDEMRWVRFLGSMTTWGPNSRRLAQVTYKKLLAKAVDCKAIPEVHPLPRTSRKTIRKVTPLLPHEVVGIIEHADSLLHQALFALAFGHGTRAGEPGLQRWEDIQWDARLIVISGGTKTEQADHLVPLAPFAERWLLRWWEDCGKPSTGWCFPWTRGKGYDPDHGKPIRNFKTALKGAARRFGGEDLAGRVFPNLGRHTFATTSAVDMGLSKPQAKLMMRHTTDSDIMEQAYIKADAMRAQQALQGRLPDYEHLARRQQPKEETPRK